MRSFVSAPLTLKVPEMETFKTNSTNISFRFCSERLLHCGRLLTLLLNGPQPGLEGSTLWTWSGWKTQINITLVYSVAVFILRGSVAMN